MVVDILHSIPLIEHAAPFLYSLAIPIFSITLPNLQLQKLEF